MDEIGKVYRPQEIDESPFPQGTMADLSVSQIGALGATGKTFGPSTTQEQSFPIKKIATELLSTMLNSRSKKILQNMTFAPSGAIQIGDYTQGVSGDIRIAPSGIVARNSLGTETIAIDGESGDAVFSGIIQTGTIVSGLALLGDGSIQIDGINRRMVWFDETTGLPVIIIGNV